MTTQQSVVVGIRGAERSQVLVKFLVRTASRGEPLFRSSRPDYIETFCLVVFPSQLPQLFRSSRPDYIETNLLAKPRSHMSLCIVPVFQTGLH